MAVPTDPRCLELAQSYGADKGVPEDHIADLAAAIQVAIDEWLEDERSEGWIGK